MPALIRHTNSPTLTVSSLHAEAQVDSAGDLLLSYRLDGDLSGVRLPPRAPPERRDALWRHTCFELFAAADGEAYREYNFSPAGHWQAYAFAGYRQGGYLDPAQGPRIDVDTAAENFTLRVHLPAADLPPGPRLRLGLTAVIEADDGRLGYWALYHPAEQPDFHRADSFVLEMDLSGTSQ